MGKYKFNRGAALLYAELRGIKLSNSADEDAIVADIEHVVGVQPDKCDCGKRIRDDDRMCWYCGGDVSPDGSGGTAKLPPGGYEVLVEEWKAQGGKVIWEEPAAEEKWEKREEPAEPELDGTGETAEEQAAPEPEPEPAPEPAFSKKEREKASKKERHLAPVEPKPVERAPEEPKTEARPAKRGDVTLTQRIKEIKTLSKLTGSSAWEIGKHLHIIMKDGLWKELDKYKAWEDFCKSEFGFTRMTANNFIRISQKFDHDEAKRLPLFHLIALSDSRLSDKDRERIYGDADKMDSAEVKSAVHVAVEEQRKAKGGEEQKPKKPRAKSPYQSLVGSQVEGRYSKEDPQKVFLQLDDLVGLELKVLKTKVSAKFVTLQPEQEAVA